MAKRLITLLAALMVLGFVIAGCGDDENSGSDSAADTVTDVMTDDETVTEDETVTDTETVTDETVTTEGGGAVVPENIEQAIEQCKERMANFPRLSEETKDNLENLCDKATGSVEDAREASLEVCKQMIEDLYPSGVPGKETALSACESGQ